MAQFAVIATTTKAGLNETLGVTDRFAIPNDDVSQRFSQGCSKSGKKADKAQLMNEMNCLKHAKLKTYPI